MSIESSKKNESADIVASIDQISCAVTELLRLKEIVIPNEVTKSSIKRATDCLEKVFLEAGFEKVGVSVRGGAMTNLQLAADILKEKNISFSSGDLPIRNWWNLKYFIEDLTVEEKRPISLAQMVGWRLHNIGTTQMLKNKFTELQDKTEKIEGYKLIRWDIYGICDDADKIVPLMDENTLLAVEYYPRFGKPDDFFDKIDQLRNKYPGKHIGISFDPIYYYMASKIHKHGVCLSPEDYFKKIINERPGQLMMVEVNQMATNSNKPHTAYADGKINFYQIFNDWGKARGNLSFIPHFAYEPSPKFYSQVMQNGKEYLVKLNDSFSGDERYAFDATKEKM